MLVYSLKMEFSNVDKALIVKLFFANNDSCIRAQREWRRRNGGNNCNRIPNVSTIKSWANRFLQTGSVQTATRLRTRSARSQENVEQVSLLNVENRMKGLRSSVRSIARDTEISKSTVHRILRKDIVLKPYRPAFLQKLTQRNIDNRQTRCLYFLDNDYTVPPILNNIIFTDEAYYSINGFICGQNWRYWGTNRDDVEEERRCFKKMHA